MSKLYDRINTKVSHWFDGLADREKKLLMVALGVVCLLLAVSIFWMGALKLDAKHTKLERSRAQFDEVKQLEERFIIARRKNEILMRSIKSNNVSLFSLIPTITAKLGLSVKGLDEIKKPDPKTGVVEVSVKITLTKLSIDKLSALIEAIETSNPLGLVKVTRLKINKSYSEPDYLDIQMTVATWKTT
jgi:hypothetical protein